MKFAPANQARATTAFTLVEIAICLAIIGIALVAIIGVLPIGMNTQRDNREETVVGQDASVLLEAIRTGARGMSDLTNYVFLITNAVTYYNANGLPTGTDIYGYTYTGATLNGTAFNYPINNGQRIIGLLSTPEFIGAGGQPIANVYNGGSSNHVVAYVRALSGVAAEKPPQDNDIMRDDAFSYRLLVVNAPVAVATNAVAQANFNRTYDGHYGYNMRELRMTFLWPLLPIGNTGKGRQTFRVQVVGQMSATNDHNLQTLYFYQPQSFTNAP